MKFGVHCSVRGGLLNGLEEAARLKCETLQIFTKSPRVWRTSVLTEAGAEQFRAARRRLKLDPIVVHTPYLPNLCTANEKLYARSEEALSDDMSICPADLLRAQSGARANAWASHDPAGKHGGRRAPHGIAI
jgi:deoxyribonuclease IV